MWRFLNINHHQPSTTLGKKTLNYHQHQPLENPKHSHETNLFEAQFYGWKCLEPGSCSTIAEMVFVPTGGWLATQHGVQICYSSSWPCLLSPFQKNHWLRSKNGHKIHNRGLKSAIPVIPCKRLIYIYTYTYIFNSPSWPARRNVWLVQNGHSRWKPKLEVGTGWDNLRSKGRRELGMAHTDLDMGDGYWRWCICDDKLYLVIIVYPMVSCRNFHCDF